MAAELGSIFSAQLLMAIRCSRHSSADWLDLPALTGGKLSQPRASATHRLIGVSLTAGFENYRRLTQICQIGSAL
jgi:hypothetical protein